VQKRKYLVQQNREGIQYLSLKKQVFTFILVITCKDQKSENLNLNYYSLGRQMVYQYQTNREHSITTKTPIKSRIEIKIEKRANPNIQSKRALAPNS